MGTNTECDFAAEAAGEDERRGSARVRDVLLGEPCSLAATRHGPRSMGLGEPQPLAASDIEAASDPGEPIGADAFFAAVFDDGQRRRGPVLKVMAAAVLILALALAWHATPLARWAEPDAVRAALATFAQQPWAPVAAVATFVAAGLVAFPVTIMIAATAAAFGPWLGLAYATAGVLASAIVTYAVGARLGRDALRNVLGPRLNRIRRRIVRQGILAMATIRLVPLAPFTVVNLVAGASAIRPIDYVAGTMLGMLPGLIVLSILGHQIVGILAHPTAGSVALLGTAVAAWIGVSVGLQVLVTKLSGDRP